MQIAILCLYPLLIHLSIVLQHPGYRVLALVLLVAGLLYKSLAQGKIIPWLFLTSISVIALLIHRYYHGMLVFHLPPIIIPALIAGIFIKSLLPGNEALITGIAEKARGPLNAKMRKYTRLVTLLWALLLISMTVLALLASWFASAWLWSIYTNFISYLMLLIFFIGEYLYRRIRFKDHDHPGFRQYIEIVRRAKITNSPP